MRILVTGGAGFVGKRLVRMLAQAGHEVFAVVRSAPGGEVTAYFQFGDVNCVVRDLATFDPASLPKGIDAVVTLAQSSRFRDFPAQAEEIFAVNVTANLRLLQWAASSGVTRFVHISSGGIYGGRPGAHFVETDLLAVDSPLGFYLGSKLCAEVVFQNYRHFFPTAIVLRPFFIFGPGQRNDMFVARIIESVRHGRPVSLQGTSGLRINPIYVDDAVTAIARAIALEGRHVINIAGADVLTLKEMSEQIGLILGSAPVFETRSGDPVDYVADIEFSRRELGIQARSFADGLRATLAQG